MSKLSGIFPVPLSFWNQTHPSPHRLVAQRSFVPDTENCHRNHPSPWCCTPCSQTRTGHSAVCRRWRDIILNTPLFWTFIQISPEWLRTSLLKAHVARSRECPLVIICLGSNWISAKASYYAALLDIVIATSHRWRSLTHR